MNKPNLVNLDRFKKKIRNVKSTSLTMPIQDLKALEADLDELLLYTIALQAMVIDGHQGGNTTEIHLGGGDFYEK